MAVILFTMRDVERSHAEFDFYDDALKSRSSGVGAAAPAGRTASSLARDTGKQAATYTRRTARGAMITVRKGLRRAKRAIAGNKIVQSADRMAGNLARDVGKTARGVGSHVRGNAGKYALGAAAVGAVGGGAAYLLSRPKKQEYSRYSRETQLPTPSRRPTSIYFSRR